MPTFKISVTNESFAATDQHDVASLDTATAEAIRAALQIGTDEVVAGKQFFAAEVKVEAANEVVRRFVVSLGASRLALPN
jgi:hypothetical protein